MNSWYADVTEDPLWSNAMARTPVVPASMAMTTRIGRTYCAGPADPWEAGEPFAGPDLTEP